MDQHLIAKPYTAWQLISMFWKSEQRAFATVFLIIVLLFTIVLVAFDVAFTTWYNYFYDALQDYDVRGAIDLLLIFCFMAAVYIIVYVYRFYVQAYLALRWRQWLTREFIDRWLAKRSYYYLENFDQKTDNPDQRIQEDIQSLVVNSLSLLVGLLSACVTIIAFVFVLWRLSNVIAIPLGSFGMVHIPGYLVWVSLIYASVGTFITFKVGRPLIMLNFEQQRREANFRFAAIDVRSHAEHVALYRGEYNQKNILGSIFKGVLENWYAIILRQKLLFWFTAGYNQISLLIPFVVALPNYFNRVFKLGGLMQAVSAFGKIQDAMSFLVNAYTTIAEWRAVIRRLITFLNHMYELDVLAANENKFATSFIDADKIVAKDLNIRTPKGKNLLTHVDQTFESGKHYVIKGPSGVGKSTFVRTLAGVWPFGQGEIALPKAKNVIFLPQTPYMPLGTLKEAILFPDKAMDVSVTDNDLLGLLDACDLAHLKTQLNEV
jgi:putative ATP-binding cassette transporter